MIIRPARPHLLLPERRLIHPRLCDLHCLAAAGFTAGHNGGSPPDPVAGARCWLRGDDVTHSSNAVSSWNDKTGNGLHWTQSVAGAKPTLQPTSGPNGTPRISFDGSADFLQLNTTISNLITSLGASTIFAVLDVPALLDSYILGATDTTQSIILLNLSAGSYRSYNVDAGGPDIITTAASTGLVGIQMRHDTGTWYMRISGIAEASIASGDTVNKSTSTPVFGKTDTGNFWAGYMMEWIFYNTALSAADLQTNRDYIAGRYSITW